MTVPKFLFDPPSLDAGVKRIDEFLAYLDTLPKGLPEVELARSITKLTRATAMKILKKMREEESQ